MRDVFRELLQAMFSLPHFLLKPIKPTSVPAVARQVFVRAVAERDQRPPREFLQSLLEISPLGLGRPQRPFNRPRNQCRARLGAAGLQFAGPGLCA